LDEKKLPRRWKPADDISKIFMEARQTAEIFLEQFALLRLSPELDTVVFLDPDSNVSVDSSLIILTPEEAVHVKDKFYKETDSAYLQAVRDQEHVSSSSHIPIYLIVLLLVLGFDEFMSILSNPLLLILCIVLGVCLYVIYILNLGGPVKKGDGNCVPHKCLCTIPVRCGTVEQTAFQTTKAEN